MLKITSYRINQGVNFCIRNSWRTQIAKKLNKDEELYPFNFTVIEENDMGYLCESIPDNKSKKKFQIVVSENVINYLSGAEIDDVNVGLYFTDYFPIENSNLLLFCNKTQTVIPVLFALSIELIGNIPYLDLRFINLLTKEEYTINSQIKKSWKLLDGTDKYMTNVEKMYQDTFVHKEYIIKVCNKFADYLEKQGFIDDAKNLRERAIIHDNSKIVNKDEFIALTSIVNDKSCLKDARSQLSSFKQDSIELHWKHNAHHPEHFDNYDDMSRLDRMEMACDWMARSLQYKNNLLEFVETRQQERFHFSELMYDEVYHYCKILVSLFHI